MRLGHAAGGVLVAREHLPHGERPAVLIGKDTRSLGLHAGSGTGGRVFWLPGRCLPDRPAAHAGHRLPDAGIAPAGVASSASHNPYYDNGIKFFSAKAPSCRMPSSWQSKGIDAPINAWRRRARARRINDAPAVISNSARVHFPNSADLRGLRIVVAVHGAPITSPRMYCTNSGPRWSPSALPRWLNINDEVGATAPKASAEVVAQGPISASHSTAMEIA